MNAPQDPIAPLRFGGVATGWDAPYAGVLDEVALYDRALGPEEVRGHCAAGARPDGVSAWSTRRGTIALVWFGGVLLEAGSVNGPWQPVAGAASPWTLVPDSPQRYYRLESASGGIQVGAQRIQDLTPWLSDLSEQATTIDICAPADEVRHGGYDPRSKRVPRNAVLDAIESREAFGGDAGSVMPKGRNFH